MKNILILSMSTLQIRKNDPKDKNEIGYIVKSKYQYCPEGDDNGENIFECYGYGQLEPIPKLLMKKLETQGEQLDKILILATDKTLNEEKNFSLEGEESGSVYQETAVSFFEKRIMLFAERNDPAEEKQLNKTQTLSIEPIRLDTTSPAPGIKDMTDRLREEYHSGETELYVDIHGGLRDQQLVLESILSLLRMEGIRPEATFTVRYTNAGVANAIEKIPGSSDVFGFVSGMSEFVNYGRADSLTSMPQYLGKEGNDLVKVIQKIAEAIQLCDIDQFERQIDRLSQKVDNERERGSFLEIFLDNIKNDYGENLIVKEKRTALELLRWCEKKGFYQQALTIIESRMPHYICSRFLKLDLDQASTVTNKTKSHSSPKKISALDGIICAKKDWQDPLNFSFEKCAGNTVLKVDGNGYWVYPALNHGDTAKRHWEDMEPIWLQAESNRKIGRFSSKVCWGAFEETIVMDCRESFPKTEIDKLNIFLQLHMALKNQRNQVNHAATESTGDSESSGNTVRKKPKREPAKSIFNAIHAYIEMADYFNDVLNKELPTNE